jgi:hypothetical protein
LICAWPIADIVARGQGTCVQTKVLKGVTVVDGVQLTRPMVALLIAHASGEQAVRVSEADTLRALMARRLIRVNRTNRPSRSLATPRGREVIAALLGQLAEVLRDADSL